MEQDLAGKSLSLTTGGITLLSVLLGIGVTVGLGLTGPWWLRLVAGTLTTLLLGVAVKLGSARGRGPLARLAGRAVDDRIEAGGVRGTARTGRIRVGRGRRMTARWEPRWPGPRIT